MADADGEIRKLVFCRGFRLLTHPVQIRNPAVKGFDDFPGNRRYVRDGFFREILFTVKPSALEAKGALDCFSEDFFKGLAFFQAAGLSIIVHGGFVAGHIRINSGILTGAELYIFL